MLIMKRIICTAAVAAAFLCTSVVAKAGDGYGTTFQQQAASTTYNWTGVGIGVGAGYGVSTSDVAAHYDEIPVALGAIKGISGDGFRGQGRVHLDLQVPNSKLVLGVFGGYGFGKSTFDVDFLGENVFTAELKPTWHAGARLGVAPGNGHTLLFVGGGYQAFEHSFSFNPALELDGEKRKVGGYFGTIGIEHMITKQISFGLDYQYTKVEKLTWSDGDGGSITSEPVDHAIMARLTLRPKLPN